MLKSTLIVLFSLVIMPAWSQQQNSVDSLKTLIAKADEDSIKVNLMTTLALALEDESPKEAAMIYRKITFLSHQLKLPKKEVSALIGQGITNYILAEWDSAIFFYKQAYSVAQKSGLKERMGVALVNIGNVHTALNQFPEALEYYQQAEPYLSLQHQSIMIGNMIALFRQMQRINEMREYGYKAIRLAEKVGDTLAWIDAHINMFSEKNDTLQIEGFRLLKKILPYAIKLHAERRLDMIYYDMAIYHHNISKNYDSALWYSNRSEEITKRIGDAQSGLIDNYTLKAQIYLLKKNYAEAKKYGMLALSLAPEVGIVYKWKEIYFVLAETEEKLKDYTNAINFYKKYILYRDSTEDVRNVELSSQLDARYQSEKKQKEINRLELLKVEQQSEINFRNSVIAIAVVALILSAVIGLLSYRNAKNRQRLVEQQKEIQARKINELEKDKQLVITEAIVKGQEEERSRLAKDLHDGLGGILWGVKSSLSTMKGNMLLSDDNVLSFERSLDMLDTSIIELRRVAHNLMPEALVKFGLTSALKDFCDFVNNSKVINVIFQQVGPERRLDLSAEVVLYRVANELINNALKHSQANEIIMQLNFDDHTLTLTVEDNGVGFDKSILEKTKGSGWPNIQSRIAYLKGTLDIETSANNGTSVNIVIPG